MKKIVIAAVVLAMSCGVAFAGHGHKYGKDKDWKDMSLEDKFMKKAHFLKMYGEEVGLTEEQVQRVKDLKYEVKRVVIQQNAEKDLLKVDIWKEIYEKPDTFEKLNELIDQKYEAKKIKSRKLVQAYVELIKIPSDEQWDELKKLWHDKKS